MRPPRTGACASALKGAEGRNPAYAPRACCAQAPPTQVRGEGVRRGNYPCLIEKLTPASSGPAARARARRGGAGRGGGGGVGRGGRGVGG
jgi:hypothetical protein